MARFGLEDYLLGGGAVAPSAPTVGLDSFDLQGLQAAPAIGLRGGGAVAPSVGSGFGAAPAVAPSTARSVRGMGLSAAQLRQAIAALTSRLARSRPGPSGAGRPQDWQAAQLRGALQQRDPAAQSFVAGLQQQDPQTLAFVRGIENQDPDTLRFIAMLQGR